MFAGTCRRWRRLGGGGPRWRTWRPRRAPKPPPRSPSRRQRPCCTCQGGAWRWCANFCPCWPTLARTAFISTSTSLGQVSLFFGGRVRSAAQTDLCHAARVQISFSYFPAGTDCHKIKPPVQFFPSAATLGQTGRYFSTFAVAFAPSSAEPHMICGVIRF